MPNLNQRQPLDFDALYGKAFRITDNSGDPNREGFSIVTPENGDAWTQWRERPEFKAVVKQHFNDPGYLMEHKYNQILKHAAAEYKVEPGTGEWEGWEIDFNADPVKEFSLPASFVRKLTGVEHKYIPISQINETQGSQWTTPERVDEILKQMEAEKWFESILVDEYEDAPGKYSIEEGHHRRRAALKMGKTTIPATIMKLEARSPHWSIGAADKKPTKKNTREFAGLEIVIEYDEGELRHGKSKDGKEWERLMVCPYGYIKDTKGAGDKEGVDVYLGADENAPNAYVVEQLKEDGKTFDEYKVMLGFDTLEEAKDMYLKHYPKSWEDSGRVGGISEIPMNEFIEGVDEHQGESKTAAKNPNIRTAMNLPDWEGFVKMNGGLDSLLTQYDSWEQFLDQAEYDYKNGEYQNDWQDLTPEQQEAKGYEAATFELSTRYDDLAAELQSWTFPMDVYREITLKNEADLKFKGIGTAWSWDESAAEAHWGSFGEGHTKWMLHARIKEANVDWFMTMYLNLDPRIGEMEKEVRLKEGTRIQLVGYKQEGTENWIAPRVKVITAGESDVTHEFWANDPNAFDITSESKTADDFNEEGYWVGEGGEASGILPVCPSKGSVCLAWRSADVHQGNCWGTIGGAVKEDKSPQESAKTELKEEIGYGGGVKLIPAFVFTDGSFSYHNFIGVVPEEFGFAPKSGHSWETDFIEWMPFEQVMELVETSPGDFHPGLVKLLTNSGETIRDLMPQGEAPKAASVHIAYLPEEVVYLKKYFNMTDAQKARELAGFNPTDFAGWLSRHQPDEVEGLDLEVAAEQIENGDADLWEIMDKIPDAFVEDYLAQGNYVMDQADAPSFLFYDFQGLVKNQWLIHFSDNASDIAVQGFKYGMEDMTTLGLTTHFTEKAKTGGGYNFAYLISDFERYGRASRGGRGSWKYGKECVVFRASGVKLWHHGDEEPQVIFWGASATDIVPIREVYGDWLLPDDRNGKPVYQSDDLGKVVNWVTKNYQQYRNKLSENVGKPMKPEPKPTTQYFEEQKKKREGLPWDSSGVIKPKTEVPTGREEVVEKAAGGSGSQMGPHRYTEYGEGTNGFANQPDRRQDGLGITLPSLEKLNGEWEDGDKSLPVLKKETPMTRTGSFLLRAAPVAPEIPETEAPEEKQEPWEMKRDEYAPRPPYKQQVPGDESSWVSEETDEQAKVRYRKQNDWEQNALAALSLGKMTPEQAKDRGYFISVDKAENFKPLPEKLYHVTTHLTEVMQSGLKTRYELAMDSGHGLGGGTDKAISFTEDIEIAKGIYSAMIEAIRVLNGTLTVAEMLKLAEEGKGASHPWITNAIRWGGAHFVSNKWNPGEPYPPLFQAFLDGKKYINPGLGAKDEDYPNAEPIGEGWVGGDGKRRHSSFLVPMDETEKRDIKFDWFKTWLYAREDAGGPLNPLFFSTDIDSLSRIPESEIAILQFKPVPGAKGTQESALGEWRTYTGQAVQLVGRVKNAASIKLGPNSNPATDAFMQEFKSQTAQNPMNPRERVWNDSVLFEAVPFGGEIILKFIRTLEKGTGQGSPALDWFTSLADKHGVTIIGDAVPVGSGLDQKQLFSWYKRHGFEVNGEELTRVPKTAAVQTTEDIHPPENEPYCDACDRLESNCICKTAAQQEYIGNCTEDEIVEEYFGDATNLAQAVENGEKVSDTSVFDPTSGLLIEYDPETDIHSFYETAKFVDNNTYWHGSPSGELRGAKYGLHIGTHEAAKQALEARIGVPVEGEWDGTREYGKTLLCGEKSRVKKGIDQTGFNAQLPEEDFYPADHHDKAKFSDTSPVLPTMKPNLFPVKIIGDMVNTPQTPRDDFKANSIMKGQITRGQARRGVYYKNEGEDYGSISAVVPGGSHIQRVASVVVAAERGVWYHGTSIKNLRPIMAEGLVPEGKPKAWATDPGAGVSTPSRQAYGGIYVTKNLMTATGAVRDDNGQDGTGAKLVVCMELQPSTFYLDEDSVVFALNGPLQHISDSEYHVTMTYIAATQPGVDASWKTNVEEFKKAYVKRTMENYDFKFKEQGQEMHPDLRKRVEALVAETWLPALGRLAAHFAKNMKDYDVKVAYSKVFTGKWDETPAKNQLFPSVEQGEADFRKHAEQITRSMRQLAYNQQNFRATARVNTPIGFSGSNHIIAVVEIRDGRKYMYKNAEDKYVVPMIVHYGKIPDDFWAQWKERFGYEVEMQQPQAKAAAAYWHDKDYAKWHELADAQRGEPEHAMLRIQHSPLAPGVFSFAVEHVGDLTHRMSEPTAAAKGRDFGFEFVVPKVRRCLAQLDSAYGFDREMEGNLENNYGYQKEKGETRSFDEMVDDLKHLSKKYADAHRALPTFNHVQKLAQSAAVNLGEWQFSTCRRDLEALQEILSKGQEAWVEAASKDDIKTAAKTIKYVTNDEGQKIPYPVNWGAFDPSIYSEGYAPPVPTRTDITKVIEELLAEEYGGMSAYDVNNGYCQEFAEELVKRVRGAEHLEVGGTWMEEAVDEPAHSFVKFEGRYYDAEASQGVKDWHNLPLFHNFKGNEKLYKLHLKKLQQGKFSYRQYTPGIPAGEEDLVGEVYLLHFDQPLSHARHYLGWAKKSEERIKQHAEGKSRARIMEVLHERGIGFQTARVWQNVSRKYERKLKNQGGLSRHCPICIELGIARPTWGKVKQVGPDAYMDKIASFVKEPRAKDDVLVTVDTRKLDEAWSRDPDFYIAPGGGGGISDRYPRFQQWLRDNPDTPIEAPIVSWNDAKDSVGFVNGRHRFSVLRDMGVEKVQVAVPKTQAAFFKSKFASGEEFFDDESQVAVDVLEEYKAALGKPGYRMKWELAPGPRVKKIWKDYLKFGFVRDEAGINQIARIVATNIQKINVNNILTGHSSTSPEEWASDILGEEIPEGYFEQNESFFDDENGAWRLSDYAADKLTQEAINLSDAKTAEDKLQILDRIFNITHARSDLSSWFVQGGVTTLDEMFGKSKKVASSPWLYHVTFSGHLEGIAKHGLQPSAAPGITGMGKKGRVFLTETDGVPTWLSKAENWATYRADNPAEDGLVPCVLRVPRKDVENLKEDEVASSEGVFGAYTADPVPSTNMEFWNGKKWDTGPWLDDTVPVADEEGYLIDGPVQQPKLAAGGVYYHATAAANIPSIAKKGLIPSQEPNWGGMLGDESLGKVYFASKPSEAMYYAGIVFRQTLENEMEASIPVCLRVRVPKKTQVTDSPHDRESWTETGVPAKNLEVWWHSKWNPIQQVANWDWEGFTYRFDEEEQMYVDWEGAPISDNSNDVEEEAKQSFMPKAAALHFKPVSFNEFCRRHPEWQPEGEEDEVELEYRYDENAAHFSTLKFPVTLYRAVNVEKGQEPNLDSAGGSWTWVEDSADAYFGQDSIWAPSNAPKLKTPVLMILKAQVLTPSDVDFDATMVANMRNPDENEVTIKPGAELKLIAIDYGQGYVKPKQNTVTASRDMGPWSNSKFETLCKYTPDDPEWVSGGYSPTQEAADKLATIFKQAVPTGMTKVIPFSWEEWKQKNAAVKKQRYTMQEVLDYANSFRPMGGVLSNDIKKYPTWELKEIPLESVRGCHMNEGDEPWIGQEYAKLTTPFPPIILDDHMIPIDGMHRVYAAKIRGDKTIQALIPILEKKPSKTGELELSNA